MIDEVAVLHSRALAQQDSFSGDAMFRMCCAKKMLLAVVGVCMTSIGIHAEFINTASLPTWNGSAAVGTFGQPNTATYGQTITVGGDTLLTDFSFRVRTTQGTTRFAAYVMQWNSGLNRATGSILFDSGLMTNVAGPSFNTISAAPNINLVSGLQYVLFLSISNFFDGTDDFAAWGQTQSSNTYSGGEFVFMNNGNNFGQLTSSSWNSGFLGIGSDLAFTANLQAVQAVPVPAGFVLFGLGAMCCGIYAKRRNKVQIA